MHKQSIYTQTSLSKKTFCCRERGSVWWVAAIRTRMQIFDREDWVRLLFLRVCKSWV